MSACCTETTGQCCGGSEASNASEPATQAETPTQQSHACCGGQAAH